MNAKNESGARGAGPLMTMTSGDRRAHGICCRAVVTAWASLLATSCTTILGVTDIVGIGEDSGQPTTHLDNSRQDATTETEASRTDAGSGGRSQDGELAGGNEAGGNGAGGGLDGAPQTDTGAGDGNSDASAGDGTGGAHTGGTGGAAGGVAGAGGAGGAAAAGGAGGAGGAAGPPGGSRDSGLDGDGGGSPESGPGTGGVLNAGAGGMLDAGRDSASGGGGRGGSSDAGGAGGAVGDAGCPSPSGYSGCPTLAPVANGSVELLATCGLARYSCGTGYLLSGDATRTCQQDGTWSGTQPLCRRPPSCDGRPGAGFDCGHDGKQDCCASAPITGGTFERDNDSRYPATVSAFRLDQYEITVGRFRTFVEAGMGTKRNPPVDNSGAHPHVLGSGWDPAWNAGLPAHTDALRSAVACQASTQTWTAGDEHRPMNCLTWYLAMAFCIWDGGRLPTELEWNYAAAGGSDGRLYPWGDDGPSATNGYAVFGCNQGTSCTSVTAIALVGSTKNGNGKWGQADLAGNVWEWVLDVSAGYPSACTDCATLTAPGAKVRVLRGGNYASGLASLYSSTRDGREPSTQDPGGGARCARSMM